MSHKDRIKKIEERIGVNKTPETLEEMFKKFDRGEYGQTKLMTLVVAAQRAKQEGKLDNFFAGLYGYFPAPLADFFKNSIGKGLSKEQG